MASEIEKRIRRIEQTVTPRSRPEPAYQQEKRARMNDPEWLAEFERVLHEIPGALEGWTDDAVAAFKRYCEWQDQLKRDYGC